MAKPEMEFEPVETFPWRQAEGYPEGMLERILAVDSETGVRTRMLRFPPGAITESTLSHDFWEEVYILEGAVTDLSLGRTFTAGMFACRPPGMKHGPYRSDVGCETFEVRYFCR